MLGPRRRVCGHSTRLRPHRTALFPAYIPHSLPRTLLQEKSAHSRRNRSLRYVKSFKNIHDTRAFLFTQYTRKRIYVINVMEVI